MMTDPIADLLTRLRNACQARKESTEIPWSRLKEGLVKVLHEEGYLRDYAIHDRGQKRFLEVFPRYDDRRRPVISNLQRVSRPGRRVYTKSDEIVPVHKGLGISILSTSQGIFSDRRARSDRIGGEVLCEVW